MPKDHLLVKVQELRGLKDSTVAATVRGNTACVAASFGPPSGRRMKHCGASAIGTKCGVGCASSATVSPTSHALCFDAQGKVGGTVADDTQLAPPAVLIALAPQWFACTRRAATRSAAVTRYVFTTQHLFVHLYFRAEVV